MGAQIREYRQRIRSVSSIKKITRAMELMAASRVVKARQRVVATTPYAEAIQRALSECASNSNVEHILTQEVEVPARAAMLVVTSDRGLAGAYASSVLKESEQLIERLHQEQKEVSPYLYGRKAVGFYKFRRREFAAAWEGGTDAPQYERAAEIADQLVEAFLTPASEGGVDEVHIVYTRFYSMVRQEPRVLRLLPIQVVKDDGNTPAEADSRHQDGLNPLYEFEPNAETVLDAVLPQYLRSRIYNCLLQAAASELAARQRAMKSATDNAEELIKTYTRLANQARQAEITQEISEIVGGANALAEAK
ncbi:F-type H+-transporting ATPase subunit gamma [Kineosphaera limosa]|uniref:ATP synthase gamma chain n=1 Tax=Kineosphaera limosa NBRC 100340 TaxID=1184609 RepID=K6WV91_9MICO|nr:F0F1 ATP synthase subunit gamma [Kineosphaera limosa]NYD99595.1 F-type H+-transporting ATPase subunit gamma [Kineosphaera limosa]GAB97761.1 ATP synthase subunit gamma [Kineosphaera limosa NBRC 100340]